MRSCLTWSRCCTVWSFCSTVPCVRQNRNHVISVRIKSLFNKTWSVTLTFLCVTQRAVCSPSKFLRTSDVLKFTLQTWAFCSFWKCTGDSFRYSFGTRFRKWRKLLLVLESFYAFQYQKATNRKIPATPKLNAILHKYTVLAQARLFVPNSAYMDEASTFCVQQSPVTVFQKHLL